MKVRSAFRFLPALLKTFFLVIIQFIIAEGTALFHVLKM